MILTTFAFSFVVASCEEVPRPHQSSEWSAVPDSIDETVDAGTIFGLGPKNSTVSAWNSHSFLSFPVRLLCSVTFLYFSSSFFHLFEHCSPVTFTEEVVLNWSAIRFQATFFLTFPLENKLSFCGNKNFRALRRPRYQFCPFFLKSCNYKHACLLNTL